ncbi:beta-mannanase [Neobacillus sp. Marseille-QA0830]
MNWEPIPSPGHEIKDLRKTVRDSEIHLTWFWSKEIDFVYIYKAPADSIKPLNELEKQDIRLYTREEYKANQGYLGRLDGFGRYAYRIFPCQKRDGNLIVYAQENKNNLIFITGAKAKIKFSMVVKKVFLRPKKRVLISIDTEYPLDKDLLVYVKKTGSPPISVEDGTVFPFVRDFPAGKTELPEIEFNKDEYIRIFFSNGKQSAEIYELIPE